MNCLDLSKMPNKKKLCVQNFVYSFTICISYDKNGRIMPEGFPPITLQTLDELRMRGTAN